MPTNIAVRKSKHKQKAAAEEERNNIDAKSIRRKSTIGTRAPRVKDEGRAKAIKLIRNTMSSNRTSIPDSMGTPHRQRNDEPDKQQQHPHAQMNATNSKQSSKSHHEECDIIGQIIGQYGKYQFFMTFLLSLFQIPNTFHISSTIYQVSTCTQHFQFPSFASSNTNISGTFTLLHPLSLSH